MTCIGSQRCMGAVYSLSLTYSIERCAIGGIETCFPTLGTNLSRAECGSAIHRELCIFWMNTKLSLIS